ncbi:MAG: ABC transporter ATP-binding protein [Deltaproteobacteria bacterium]|nr:ABC transporter ATP-binding protein [Deltaproteobacteria bacterium]MBW2070064.1 ABC transporter ATP-binding protein [Deltaproteobacteria bacterium]
MEDKENISCVELRNLVKRFAGITAVDHINLEVRHGEVFSLLGPSGCGKTTTLRIIAGLETMDEGEVLIDGKVINDVPPYKRDCNLVFQNLALFPHMTLEENIAYGLERKGLAQDKIRKKVGEMLELVQLTGMEKRYPAQLSGGQQQRIALARSLVLRPKILLLDEPLAALDRKLRKDMQGELKRIQQEIGTTFFYVTHDQKVALAISDTIAVMQAGKLEQIGIPEEIYGAPRTRFVADFMGVTNIFLGKVIARGGREIQLETESGLTVTALIDEESDSDDIVGICVHPERVNVLPAGTAGKVDNAFRGRIIEMIYQGNFVEMKICLSNSRSEETVTAHLDARLVEKYNHRVGEETTVHWDRESSTTLQG